MFPPSLLTFISLAITASATCYFPDGDVSPADVACDSSASDSFCCYSNQACLSNGICMTGEVDGVMGYARGTCTDQNWQSGACPNFCLDQQGLGNIMFSCNVTGSDQYCCNEDCSCSENGQNQVVSFTGTPYTLTVIGVEGATYPNPSATTSQAASTSPASTSPASSSATATSSSSLVVSASTVAAATSGATAAGAASASPSSSSSGGGSDAVAIGVGVGVGVGGALLLSGLIAFVVVRRRKARAQKNTQPMADTKDSLPGYTNEGQGHTGGAGTPHQQTAPPPMSPHQYSQTDNVSELGQSATHARSEMAAEHGRPPAELSG